MLEVVFHPAAYEELAHARSWYDQEAPGLGHRLMEQMEQAIIAISGSPATWPTYCYGTRRFLVHRFPFAIVYRHDTQLVQVIAFMHLKRKPGYWLSRVR